MANQMMLASELVHETEPLLMQQLPDCVQDADDDQDGLGIRYSRRPARSLRLMAPFPLTL